MRRPVQSGATSAEIANAFNTAEHAMTHRPRQDRDQALVRYTLQWLTDAANPRTAAVVEAIDRVRARQSSEEAA